MHHETPAESFVHDESREMFDNAGEFHRLYPDGCGLSFSGHSAPAAYARLSHLTGVIAANVRHHGIDAGRVVDFLRARKRCLSCDSRALNLSVYPCLSAPSPSNQKLFVTDQ
jgi:hypothetical protein